MELTITQSRRELLRIGALSVGGLTLPRLLRGADRKREVSCIVIFQNGGCCQQSSWDPKPDAPSDIRGSFKDIPTAIPGVHFGDLLPKSAKMANKFAVIRSVTSDIAIHNLARRHMMSGTRPRTEMFHPSYGAVVSRERGSRNGLPAYVTAPGRDDSFDAGFLGAEFDQFIAGDPKDDTFKVKDVGLPEGMTLDEALSNKRLLDEVDQRFRAVERSPLIGAMDEFYQKAIRLVSSPDTKKAFRIQDEPGALRDRYGRTTVGQSALLARRLIEAGVRVVTVNHGGYDTHTGHEPAFRKLLPDFDSAFTTLIEDLEQRGMLANTLVLAAGEFGRTPKLNPAGGRDHWPGVFSVAMAGAGVPGGLVLGSSDRNASAPSDRPVKVDDIGATVYKLLGIDAAKALPGPNRPVLINKDGVAVKEIV